MKLALIPPKGYYQTALQSEIHLVLAQIEDPAYVGMYEDIPSHHHVILDNGAAEGALVTEQKLMRRAAHYGVDEIVVPDVLRDWQLSVMRARTFARTEVMSEFDGQLMLVAQGNTLDEVYRCIDHYLVQFPNSVIGVPRHLLTTTHNMMARVNTVAHIESTYGRRPVHLLGTNAGWPQEVLHIAMRFPWVRSVDTSMPYNYTIAGRRLRANDSIEHRPEAYFDQVRSLDSDLMTENINTMMEWASGTEGARS